MSLVISSTHNAVFKDLLKLLKPKCMREQGVCLVSGEKLVRELLKFDPNSCEQFILCEDSSDSANSDWVRAASTSLQRKSVVLSAALFNEIDLIGAGSPLLLYNFSKHWMVAESHSDELRQKLNTDSFVVSAVGDPGNMGAIIRSAVAFGVTNIMLLQEGAFPFSQKVIKASAGAVFKTKIWRGPSIQKLALYEHINSINLVALDLSGESLNSFIWSNPFHLLVGEEGQGVPENVSAHKIHIPMSNEVESLNAAVSVGIALHASRR